MLVTRARNQASQLADRLKALGAVPWVLSAIEIVAVPWCLPAGARLADYDWIIFTSSNAVRSWSEQIPTLPNSIRIAAVGPTTAEAVAVHFRTPDAMPTTFLSREILGAIGEVNGQRILLPQGDLARADLRQDLLTAGALRADTVEVYRTVAAEWPQEITETPDLISFTSSSGVLATHERLAERGLLEWLTTVPCVCIGPLTAGTLRDLGSEPAGVAAVHTLDGLIEEIVRVAALLPE